MNILMFNCRTLLKYRSINCSLIVPQKPLHKAYFQRSSQNFDFHLWIKSCYETGRYGRPTGTWLLYLPCTWGIALGASPGDFPDLQMLALFGVGSLLMRGAGCTINDMWDSRYDKQVERSKNRPLATGSMTKTEALVFLGLQLSAALIILLQLNWYSVYLGLASMILVTTYPLFKRFTYWPQLCLGLAFNWGTMLGYSAIVGHIDLPIIVPLYLTAISWTIVYDTIYAYQSTAILFGEKTKPILALFQSGMALSLIVMGINTNSSWIYYTGTLITIAHTCQLLYKTRLDDPQSCLKTFKSSTPTGLLLTLTIVLEKLFGS